MIDNYIKYNMITFAHDIQNKFLHCIHIFFDNSLHIFTLHVVL
jgi:hypothetical protein